MDDSCGEDGLRIMNMLIGENRISFYDFMEQKSLKDISNLVKVLNKRAIMTFDPIPNNVQKWTRCNFLTAVTFHKDRNVQVQ